MAGRKRQETEPIGSYLKLSGGGCGAGAHPGLQNREKDLRKPLVGSIPTHFRHSLTGFLGFPPRGLKRPDIPLYHTRHHNANREL